MQWNTAKQLTIGGTKSSTVASRFSLALAPPRQNNNLSHEQFPYTLTGSVLRWLPCVGAPCSEMTTTRRFSSRRWRSWPPASRSSASPFFKLLVLLVLLVLLTLYPQSQGPTHAGYGVSLVAAAVIPASTGRRPSYPEASVASACGRLSPARGSHTVVAWGEGWELDEDIWERLGTRILDFVLRRKEPEEPHPLRMQRWTISMRRLPFFRRVIRHMQFYPDGRCEVEEEIGGRPLLFKRQHQPTATATAAAAGGKGGGGGGNGQRRKRRKKGGKKGGKGAAGPPLIQGKWKYDKYGLNWELEERGLKHFFHAELIWHSFGDRPKMHCGVIVRNRGPRSLLPPWLFRPVVGVFSGLGNGTDTCLVPEAQSNENRFRNY